MSTRSRRVRLPGGLGLGEGLDQRRERAVVDAPGGLGRRDREADRQVRFPDAWRAEQDHVLAAVQEAELVQALDLLALDAGLEGEVELIERLHSRQPRRAHGGLETAVVAQHDLGVQQLLDGLGRRDRAAVGVREDAVDGLQRARHLEVRQHCPQPVAPGRRRSVHCSASA